MLGGRESFDLADLGDDQQRRVAADPADLAEQLDALVGFGALVDLAGGRGDLAVKVADQREQAVESSARPVGQLQRGEVFAAGCAEQVCVLGQDALAGQQRVHAVLDRRAQVNERRAVPEQVAQVAQLRRGDVGLGQQPGAEQVRERSCVDRVGLHPARRRSHGCAAGARGARQSRRPRAARQAIPSRRSPPARRACCRGCRAAR